MVKRSKVLINTLFLMFKFYALVFLLSCSVCLTAQVDYDFFDIDRQIKKAPKITSGALSPLYDYISTISQNELEQVRAIHQWIIVNITYDKEAYKNGKKRINQGTQDILNRQTAICWGYAKLFHEMAQQLGVESAVISGYARPLLRDTFALKEANHTWNAVKIDEKWYLLDLTWNSSLLEDRKSVV